MASKIKTYVLMVSKIFPAYHPRKGQPTFFKEAIEAALENKKLVTIVTSRRPQVRPVMNEQERKLHTIRGNYDLWAKRAEKINRGEAVLSLRQWTGSPYNFKRDGSKPVEFLRLEKIGVQKVSIKILSDDSGFGMSEIMLPSIMQVRIPDSKKYGSIPMRNNVEVPRSHLEFFQLVAKNDGLNDYDFKYWFKKYFEGVIIHFTDFRY